MVFIYICAELSHSFPFNVEMLAQYSSSHSTQMHAFYFYLSCFTAVQSIGISISLRILKLFSFPKLYAVSSVDFDPQQWLDP